MVLSQSDGLMLEKTPWFPTDFPTRTQFVTFLGPPLTPEPVSSPVVRKLREKKRAKRSFGWAIHGDVLWIIDDNWMLIDMYDSFGLGILMLIDIYVFCLLFINSL